MTRARATAAVVVAVLLGATLRCVPIIDRPLWYDEAFTWYVATPAHYGSWLRWQSKEPSHPPGSFVAVALSMSLFGTQAEWAVRAPSVVAGILLIPAMGVLATAAAGPVAGATAALFAALAPNMVDQGQQARMFSMLALLEVLTLTYAIRLLDRPPQRSAKREALSWALLGSLLGAMLWLNHLALAIATGVFVAVAWCALQDIRVLGVRSTLGALVCRLLAAGVGAAIVALPGLMRIARMLLATSSPTEPHAVVSFSQIAFEVAEAAVQLTGGGVGAVLAYALAMFGLTLVWRRRKRAGVLLLSVGFFSLLIAFPLRARHPFFAPRYLGAMEPILWVGVAAAVAMAASTRHSLLRLGVGAAAMTSLVVAGRASMDAESWMMSGRSRVPAATARLVSQVRAGDLVVFHPEYNRIVGYYYGLPRTHPLQTALFEDPAVALPTTLQSSERPERLWMVAGFTSLEDWGLAWLAEQRSEVRAFARWYGHEAEGEALAAKLVPGDTFVARFDAGGVELRVVDDEKLP